MDAARVDNAKRVHLLGLDDASATLALQPIKRSVKH